MDPSINGSYGKYIGEKSLQVEPFAKFGKRLLYWASLWKSCAFGDVAADAPLRGYLCAELTRPRASARGYTRPQLRCSIRKTCRRPCLTQPTPTAAFAALLEITTLRECDILIGFIGRFFGNEWRWGGRSCFGSGFASGSGSATRERGRPARMLFLPILPPPSGLRPRAFAVAAYAARLLSQPRPMGSRPRLSAGAASRL